MRGGEIEETAIPRNPLDVLAQQIVAIVADEEIEVADAARARPRRLPVRRPLARCSSRTCSTCSPAATRPTSSPSCGRASSGTAPRGVIRGRDGARRLAVTNAGTIPDRGLFGVHLVDGGGRVGELDEEMVYEARPGQTFLLGASSWRIEEITRDRVLVSPAPGRAGSGAVLEGRGRRPAVRARREDRRAPRASSSPAPTRRRSSASPRGLPRSTRARRRTCSRFLREQAAATGVVPSDRTIVVERFRDEIGDWRVCILTPFGGRVHAPWAMALAARLRDSLGLEAQSIWSDDGIALHLPDADAPPTVADLLIGPDEIEELVVAEVGQTALFGARFRENAARALLIPRRRPGQRTPLWQQRLKAQTLLQVARQVRLVPDRARDLPRVPAGRLRPARAEAASCTGLQTRELDLVEVETASASPFAASLLFDYVATYMYEDDTPPAERRAQALSLDRDLLRELLGQEELRELLDPDALAEVERQLRGEPRDPDELHDLLRRRGDLRAGRVRRGARRRSLRRRAARAAGARRRRGAADRGRGRGPLPRRARRDAAGRAAGGVPRGRARVAPPARRSASRKGRGPFTTAEATSTSGSTSAALLHELERADLLVRGELRPGGTEREWCDPDVLRRLRRASLAALRREVEPAEQAALGRFLPAWHGIGRRAGAARGARPAAGARRCRSRSGSARCCPRRVPGYQPAWLDALCAAGEVVWVGAGLDRVAVYFREDAAVLGRPAGAPRPETPEAQAIRAALGRSAMFWSDLLAADRLSRRRRRCRRSGSSSGRAR